ncbi:MAG TPA: aspartate--tRNA ligase, partial [Clostridia bacterium]|nr:aspartate--tRNA ligase [Clostridia bacterium]
MAEGIMGLRRSKYCGEVCEIDAGKELTLMGWVQRRRDLGSLIFLWLRDRSGIVQVTFDQSKNAELFKKAQQLSWEYCIAVRGTVVMRTPENINPDLKTGTVEVIAEELRILSESQVPPFAIEDDVNVNDALKLKYRYLDLRRPSVQSAFFIRHKIAAQVRNYLDSLGFTDIETPVLTKSTPEGARDYLVPSRVHPGSFYALPQSPQLFKQLLMVAGFDRYYQIVKCFRDEDLRADRQPEFTQIDLEMSFADADDVMNVTEGMIARVFKEALGIKIELPLKRMPYAQCMDRFGSDKPDLRFGMEIRDLTPIVAASGFKVFDSAIEARGSVRGILVPGGGTMTRKEIDSLTEHVKTYRAKGLAWLAAGAEIRSSFAKFISPEMTKKIIAAMQANDGDMIFIIADSDKKTVCEALGQLRLELG